jgi:hypothetical protein
VVGAIMNEEIDVGGKSVVQIGACESLGRGTTIFRRNSSRRPLGPRQAKQGSPHPGSSPHRAAARPRGCAATQAELSGAPDLAEVDCADPSSLEW